MNQKTGEIAEADWLKEKFGDEAITELTQQEFERLKPLALSERPAALEAMRKLTEAATKKTRA